MNDNQPRRSNGQYGPVVRTVNNGGLTEPPTHTPRTAQLAGMLEADDR